MPNKEESVLEDFIGTVCTEVFVRVLHVLLNFRRFLKVIFH